MNVHRLNLKFYRDIYSAAPFAEHLGDFHSHKMYLKLVALYIMIFILLITSAFRSRLGYMT
jgi:hypothetical protein